MTATYLNKKFIAPALPTAPVEYDYRREDQFQYALRLYFNLLDTYLAAISGPTGGGSLGMPHIAASDTTSQYAGGNNTATLVTWNTLDSGNGFTLNNDGSATALVDGIYKIDYSLQFANTSTSIHEAYVWLKVNGNNVVGSASKFSIPNSHGGVDGYLVAYSSITFEMNVGDDVTLYWATNLAYNPVGPVNGIYMEAYAAQTSPFSMPSIPSAVGSITFVSAIPA